METSTIIVIVVAVVVVLILLAVIGMVMKRKKAEQRRHEAAELRSDAAAHAGNLQGSDQEARAAQAEADRKRVEAERAEAEAAEKQQAHAQEKAEVEGRVREADRLDPDVDHKAKDYAPTTPDPADAGHQPQAGEGQPGTAAQGQVAEQPAATGTGPAHRADPAPGHRADPGGPVQPQVQHPEGTVVNADGTLTYPDGSVRGADGTTLDSGGPELRG